MIRTADTRRPDQAPMGENPMHGNGASPSVLVGSSMADRFCAWKGQAARSAIFSVFPMGPGPDAPDLPLEGGAVMLGVRREGSGARRVVWSCAVGRGRLPASLTVALQALASASGGEVHLHLLAEGDAAREAMVADLGFPRLVAPRSGVGPQAVAMALGASMNPPDWRRHRSA